MEEMKEPDAFAKDMVRLCGMMSRADGEDDNTEKRTEDEEESVEMLLERMRQEIPDEEDERYAECIEFAKEEEPEGGCCGRTDIRGRKFVQRRQEYVYGVHRRNEEPKERTRMDEPEACRSGRDTGGDTE